MKKGDIVEINGKLHTLASDPYTKVVFDGYDRDIHDSGGLGGTAVGVVNVIAPNGIMTTVRLDRVPVRLVPDGLK